MAFGQTWKECIRRAGESSWLRGSVLAIADSRSGQRKWESSFALRTTTDLSLSWKTIRGARNRSTYNCDALQYRAQRPLSERSTGAATRPAARNAAAISPSPASPGNAAEGRMGCGPMTRRRERRTTITTARRHCAWLSSPHPTGFAVHLPRWRGEGGANPSPASPGNAAEGRMGCGTICGASRGEACALCWDAWMSRPFTSRRASSRGLDGAR